MSAIKSARYLDTSESPFLKRFSMRIIKASWRTKSPEMSSVIKLAGLNSDKESVISYSDQDYRQEMPL